MMNRLKNLIMNSIARCTVSDIVDGSIQSARVQGLEDESLEAVERLQNYGLNSWPSDGAQGLMLSVGGSRDHAIIVSADFPLARFPVEKSEVALYSENENHVHLKADGSIEIKSSKLSLKNGSEDLVALMVDLLAALEAATISTAIGPQPFINLADFTALKLKIMAFQE